jgi:hypothetical protein
MAHGLAGARGFHGVELLTNTEKLTKLGRLMRTVGNGAELKKDLIKALRVAVEPGVQDVKAKLSGLPSSEARPSLGGYLRARVRTQVRLTGDRAGVRVRIQQTPALRDFKLAAKRLNQQSWRRKNLAGNWTEQVSPIPGYFDETLYGRRDEYRAAVMLVINRFARRIGERL